MECSFRSGYGQWLMFFGPSVLLLVKNRNVREV